MGIGAAVPMVVVGALALAPVQPPAFEPRELEAIREAVARYVIETQEPICRNYWDGVTYCLEFEQGEQPSDAFLQRLEGLPVGARAAEGVFEGSRFLHPDLDFTVLFPERWSTENNRAQASAVAPDQQGFMTMEVVAQGDDPLIGAKIVQEASRASVPPPTERLTVGGLPAARTRLRGRTDTREVTALLAWIAYKGRIYQIGGVTPLERSEAFGPVFASTMQSFRPLTQEERGSIREDRLRLVEAREGETVSALAARSGTRWSAAMVAVVNGLAPSDRLKRGQLVKVSLSELYTTPGR